MKRLFLILSLFLLSLSAKAENFTIKSPSSNIEVRVNVAEKTYYTVFYKGKQVINDSPLAMSFSNGIIAGEKVKLGKIETRTVKETLTPAVKQKFAKIEEHFNEITINTKNGYKIVFRAYDDGMAYRFVTSFKEPVEVNDETVEYRFAKDFPTLFGKEKSMFTHQEVEYLPFNLSQIKDGMIASPPMVVTVDNGVRVLLTEADLLSYAGLYYTSKGDNVVTAQLPKYVLETVQPRDRDVKPVKVADYIAKCDGKREYPWRAMIISDRDGDLVESNMIYKLSSPSRIEDTSWIKPGKVAWDWWTASRLYNVDFKSGVNTLTYKAYIDFAAKYGLEYIIIDEGWYDLKDIMTVLPEINIEEVCNYGKEKGVGVILWTTWKALEDKTQEAMDQFAKWGVKGIKIDFMQRDDQWMVDWYVKIADMAAKRQLLIDYHGCYHPTGLHRTYPNVMTYEAVKGLEQYKWAEMPTAVHNTTLPFTRMVSGPMDYTPGGMNNLHEKEFKINFYRPATIGTRAHQLALYVIFESPLQMLADTPTAYYAEPLSMEFLSVVPAVWDDSKVLEGVISEYIIMARKNGENWYLGGITVDKRNAIIKLDFLDDNATYSLDIWEEGKNVDVHAKDIVKKSMVVKKGNTIDVEMFKAGGWVAILKKK